MWLAKRSELRIQYLDYFMLSSMNKGFFLQMGQKKDWSEDIRKLVSVLCSAQTIPPNWYTLANIFTLKIRIAKLTHYHRWQ